MWTRTKPNVDGYYWVRSPGHLTGKPYIRPCHLYSSTSNSPQSSLFSDGDNFSADSSEYEWWSDKIKEPTE
jgi:hypothetical protein